MHPEIVQIGPGSCPICGMALEPKEITLDDTPDPELIGYEAAVLDLGRADASGFCAGDGGDVRRLQRGLLVRHTVGLHVLMWMQFVLATPVVLWGGWPFFRASMGLDKERQPEYVHADRDRHRSGVSAQPCGAVRARMVSRLDA